MNGLKFYDTIMIAYCFVLLMAAAVFLGHEIALVKVGSELRHASKTIQDCNLIITRINKK
jgi:hypothetical protein